jgi:hypothetical protein
VIHVPELGSPPQTCQQQRCTICLEDDSDVIQRGCCCRGDAGAVHAGCLITFATFTTESRGDYRGWTQCDTCHSLFTGPVQLGLAEARVAWAAAASNASETDEQIDAASCLAAALYQQGRYDEAAVILARLVTMRTTLVGKSHSYTLIAKNNLALMYCEQGAPTRPCPVPSFESRRLLASPWSR